jgi:ArsR family transcriptional regulator, lead/cadmium/zinc/bismuth-responsive transcriptional repressor
MRRQPLSDASAFALAETFRALGDLTRVRMLDALARSELCVQDLAVSHQLRLLRNMRLVRTRRDGRLVYYALDDQHIVGLFEQGLEHVEEREGREGRPRHSSEGGSRAKAGSRAKPGRSRP